MVSGRLRTSGGVMRVEELEVGKTYCREGWGTVELLFIGVSTVVVRNGSGKEMLNAIEDFCYGYKLRNILAYKKLYAYRMDSGQVIWRTALQEGLERLHNFDIEVGK